jgi:hypothetical protein
MKLSWVLVANAIVVGLYGVVAVLAPGPLYDLYGGESDIGSRFLTQISGAALIGEAILRWGLRDVTPGRTRDVLMTALFVEYALALIASLMAQLGGVTNVLGWMIVGLVGAFALAYGYFRFVDRPRPAASAG